MRALPTLSLATAFFVLLTGCRHAPISYQLRREGSDTLLVPPTRAANNAAPALEVSIKNARKNPSSPADCDIDGPLITLHWNGNNADVRLTSATYSDPGDQSAGRAPGLFLAPVQSLDAFRSALVNLEATGCLSADEDQRLRRTLVERLPLPPYIAYLFRFGVYGITGFFDINADFRLQVVSPVYAADKNPSSGQPIGYETAYYVFTSAKNENSVKISLDSVTETDVGKQPFQKPSTQNALPLPASSGYFRLLFKTDASSADHITIATLLSATDETKLSEATKLRESGPGDSCQGLSVPDVTCLTFPRSAGVSPEMHIRVNGQNIFVPLVGGTVREALHLQDSVTVAPKTLIVSRQFQGHLIPIKFDPSSADILNFDLMPGDEITW